jgi:ubiquinone biosynthesis protein COQ4
MAAAQPRIQPRRAMRAIRNLMQNPERTDQVFEIIDALAGNASQRGLARLRTTTTGPRLLAEKRRLIESLRNRDYLRSLPDGSFGRAYLAFMERENLSADGLVEASAGRQRGQEDDADQTFYNLQLRDMHDLWHIVTGYGRDAFGELCVLAFTYGQTRNRGIGTIVMFGLRNASRVIGVRAAWRGVSEGYRRGRAAAWLPAQDWLALLALPLDAVRQALNIAPAHHYVPSAIAATNDATEALAA